MTRSNSVNFAVRRAMVGLDMTVRAAATAADLVGPAPFSVRLYEQVTIHCNSSRKE
jgi:hypothetical protein